MAVDTTTLRASAKRAIAASSPVTLARAVARNVYGLASVILTAYGWKRLPAGYQLETTALRSWVWPAAAGASSAMSIGSSAAGTGTSCSPSDCSRPNWIVTSAWPSRSAITRC